MAVIMLELTAKDARIFRITHVDNVPWILANGLHCRRAGCADPNFVEIGCKELIAKRSDRQVPLPPNGTFSDYIPFYFTPYSVMLFNIKTGQNAPMRPMRDIAIIASSLHTVANAGIPFVFTDRQANTFNARFFAQFADLSNIDWKSIQARDFRKNTNDLEKCNRYLAEAMVHSHLPVSAFQVIACYNSDLESKLKNVAARSNVTVPIRAIPDWYFQ